MRRRRNTSGDDDAAVDMTPMLDIVFIMLIFFIVTATFIDFRGLDMTQPPPPPEDQNTAEPKPAITVYVNEQNFCAVDGRSTDCGDVAVAVEGLLSDKPGANIILRVHEQARHGILVSLKDVFDQKSMNPKIEVVRG